MTETSPDSTTSSDGTAGPKPSAISLSGPGGVLAAISWLILIGVMYGGYALLGLLTGAEIDDHHEQFFRAGHGHAGVLMMLAIIYALCLSRTGWSSSRQVWSWLIFLFGGLVLSGSFFLHMGIGEAGQGTVATSVMAPVGALIVAAGVIILAVGLIRPQVGNSSRG